MTNPQCLNRREASAPGSSAAEAAVEVTPALPPRSLRPYGASLRLQWSADIETDRLPAQTSGSLWEDRKKMQRQRVCEARRPSPAAALRYRSLRSGASRQSRRCVQSEFASIFCFLGSANRHWETHVTQRPHPALTLTLKGASAEGAGAEGASQSGTAGALCPYPMLHWSIGGPPGVDCVALRSERARRGVEGCLRKVSEKNSLNSIRRSHSSPGACRIASSPTLAGVMHNRRRRRPPR